LSYVAAANASRVLIDGKDPGNVQSVDFKITRNRQNIHAVGKDERIAADWGALLVQGAVRIRSGYPELDKKLYQTVPAFAYFQIVVEMAPQGSSKPVRKITFDECILEDKSMTMDATGVPITTYNFTATRISEE